ncbi:outer membrane protein assembly factor BamB family protein [Kitasatospora sp. NBC_01250]|uniref:outer membrane protein assembly factor BamB family protein n=1 Tax=Kitasatospora sp. NBC_01250 TaxID=2903571 RepID=UPI002E33FDB3|nr:PQQ-binding-like beta-propeller repeat protein [Kitasatospora sp. NBC_01250]
MAGDQRGAGVDPAAVADQMTQLGGAPVPAQAPPGAPAVPPQPAGAPGGAPGAAPGAAANLSYQPTAAAFPAQPGATPPPGAPVGPYDPRGGSSYGYPQTAPQQPPAPPVFGAQQGGYAQPAPPVQPVFGAQQGGYGQQGATGYGFPGPAVQVGPAPTKQRNPVMVFGAIAGTVLSIAIVIGLVVLFGGNKPTHNTSGGTTGGGGGGGDAGKLAVSWTVPKVDGSASDQRTIGLWTTDKLLVRGDATGLTGYNLSDGKVAWTLKVPDGTKSFCSMSKSVNKNNIGGVSFNLGDDDCAAVGAIDATTGRLIYKVGSPLSSKSFQTQVTVTDTTLAAASGSLLAGFNLTDGSSVWHYNDRAKYCSDNADAAGAVIAVSDDCAEASPEQQLTLLDANTGKTTETFNLGSGERLTNIVSASPLVVQISSGYDNDYFVGVDSSGNPEAKIPLKVTGQDRLQLSAASDPMTKSLVIGNNLYVEVDQSGKTAIRAIDLVGGKTLWTVDGGAENGLRLVDNPSTPTAVTMDGFGKSGRVVSLSPVDGSVTQLAAFSSKANASSFMPFQGAEVFYLSDGRVLNIPQLPMENTATMYSKG